MYVGKIPAEAKKGKSGLFCGLWAVFLGCLASRLTHQHTRLTHRTIRTMSATATLNAPSSTGPHLEKLSQGRAGQENKAKDRGGA